MLVVVRRTGSYFKTIRRGERETDRGGEEDCSSIVDCRARCNVSRRGEKKREREIKLQNIRPGTRDGPRAKQSSRLRIEIISKGEEEREAEERDETRQSARRARERSTATEAERERWSERAIIEDLNGWAGSR